MSLPARKREAFPAITAVRLSGHLLVAALSDGRQVSIPIAWFPRLASATRKQLLVLEISPGGYGIHWPEIDEDISVKAFLEGLPG